jgi:glycosyltransferase involved in cell wall biosynthesis
VPRVALVTHRFLPDVGGVELHVAELAKRLRAHGWEADVFTQAARNGRERLPDGTTVWRFAERVTRSPYPTAPGLWRHLHRHAAGYDLVHAHNFHALPALAAALTTRGPLVFTPHYHGLGSTRRGRLLHRPYRPAGRHLMHRADRVICVSAVEAERVARDFPEVAVTVIPNGIDADALHRAEPFPAPTPVVLTTGRLHPFKRVDRVLAAMAALDVPGRLVVTGDGPAAADLRRTAAALGLADRVAFLGTVEREELERWLRTAAVYISLSESEAFGIGVAEGAAAGARVLASDIHAHREIAAFAPDAVELVPTDADGSALAARIAAALTAGPPPAGAGAGVPTWDAVTARTAALYEELT